MAHRWVPFSVDIMEDVVQSAVDTNGIGQFRRHAVCRRRGHRAENRFWTGLPCLLSPRRRTDCRAFVRRDQRCPVQGHRESQDLRSGLLEAKMKTTVSHEEAQINRFRKDPDRAVSYLNACLDVAFKENDPELVLSALSTVARAFGLSRLARDTELRRESLHRMLRKR